MASPLLSPVSSPHSARSGRSARSGQELVDVLDENARLWKRLHALQERSHDMCAENVDLRRQINTLRSRSKASAPLTLTLDTTHGLCSPIPPSPHMLPRSPINLMPTPVSATAAYPPGPAVELKKDVERLEDDNARLLASAAEGRTTIRQLRRQLEAMTRERERCACRHSLRPEHGRGHRRSSSNSLSAASGEWADGRSPPRRKWDWERERSERRDEWGGSPPDIVGGHMRTPSVRSLVE